MKAKGLDPQLLLKPEEEEEEREIRLVLPPVTTASDRGKTEKETSSDNIQTLRHQDGAHAKLVQSTLKQSEPANDRGLPSSTPVPPPLNVPIVTHSKSTAEGQSSKYQSPLVEVLVTDVLYSPSAVKPLYDDRAGRTTRVRFCQLNVHIL